MSLRPSLRLTAAISHEDRLYIARCLEVEVTSQGGSVEEALRNLREALELYFEDTPPPPGLKPSMVEPVDVQISLAS